VGYRLGWSFLPGYCRHSHHCVNEMLQPAVRDFLRLREKSPKKSYVRTTAQETVGNRLGRSSNPRDHHFSMFQHERSSPTRFSFCFQELFKERRRKVTLNTSSTTSNPKSDAANKLIRYGKSSLVNIMSSVKSSGGPNDYVYKPKRASVVSLTGFREKHGVEANIKAEEDSSDNHPIFAGGELRSYSFVFANNAGNHGSASSIVKRDRALQQDIVECSQFWTKYKPAINR
jgi:hypothetical protein